MKLERILYRAAQFREAIWAVPDPVDLKLAQTYLNHAQMELFLQMQDGEQAHSLRVLKQLLREPLTHENNQDLLVAALLHDVGKSRHALSLWERVLIVLLRSLFPTQSKKLGAQSPTWNGDLQGSGWRRAFIIAEQHPHWGAELASAAGTSQLASSLILRHQSIIGTDPVTLEDRLLILLQAADSSC